LIAYLDNTNGDLKAAHCANAACSSATITALDTFIDVGYFPSITIGRDGLGLISYYDSTFGALGLKVAHCSNLTCSGATLSPLDTAVGDVGRGSAIILGDDGLGLISYYDATNGDLKIAHCVDLTCTSAVLSRLDVTGNVGQNPSIVIGNDGLGLISYYDATNVDLKVVHCANMFCSSYFRRR